MNPFNGGIDFIVVSYYRIDYIKLLIKSIRKFVKHPYLITIVANETPESKEYLDLFKTYKSAEDVNIIPGTNQVSFEERGGMAGVKWETDKFGNKFGPGSRNHSRGLTLGMKNTNQKYICFLDNDVVFLNNWVDDILPMTKKYLFITSRFEKNIARPMFMIFKRGKVPYPDYSYVDSCGNITKYATDNNLEFKVLKNSLDDNKLYNEHLIKVPHGEQTYINDKPFHFHYGRGGSREIEKYKIWVKEVKKFLNEV
ncbi:hypothetical protein CL614_10520 [archaeon]|nr:hypothetical protein [archaeon]|tara:strand:- start:813 stop:1574 length:762 start_codon:yes stop_codon:yes gene_type:complete